MRATDDMEEKFTYSSDFKPAAAPRKMLESYRKACDALVCELKLQWGMGAAHGYWVGGKEGGVYDFDGELALGMRDIAYAVSHGVQLEQAEDWLDYVCWASDYGFRQPTLEEYLEGSVGLAGAEARQRINAAKAELDRLCDEERERITEKPSCKDKQ